MNEFFIGSRPVGPAHDPLVIAELGINHEGSLDVAIEIADAAINAGAEVIKHQTHVIDDEMSIEAKGIIPGNSKDSIFDIIQRCALSEPDEYKLQQYVKSKKCIFISTPFSRAAANRLNQFGVPAFKIGSGECNNYLLVKHIANFGKPIILSTGMNSVETIKPSVEILRKARVPFALLHCTNVYPTPPELVRLGAITTLREEFPDAVIGLSDHTTSNFTSLGAVALGASIIERHFTDTKIRKGPDISSSMNTEELRSLIIGSRVIHSALGGSKNPIPEESQTMAFAFSSVVAIEDIQEGEKLNEKNLWVMRPGGGDFKVTDFEKLIGRTARHLIKKGYQLKKEDLTEND